MAGLDRQGSNVAVLASSGSMIAELKKLLKHSAVYGIGNILSKIAGCLLIPVYTRCLSPADYGVIELLDLTLYFISMFVGMGLSSAILRFYYSTKDEDERNCIVSTALIFMSSLSIVVVFVCVLFDTQISLLLFKSKGNAFFFDLMIITFFFSSLIEIPLVLLRAQQRSAVFSFVTILRLALALVLNIYFIVIAGWGVTGFLVSGLTTSVIISLILVVTTLGKAPIRFSFNHLKQMVAFGAPLLPSALGMFWINFGDRFVLKQCFSNWDVGIYSLGYKFAIMLSFLVGQPFFLIWSARMYELIERKDGERLYARFCTYFTVVIAFAGLGLSLIITGVMKIVPSESYFAAHSVVPIIALGYVLRELSDFFRGVLFIAKKPSYVSIVVMITTAVCTALYLTLIPLAGINGAAFSTLLTFAFMAMCMLFFAQRIRRIPYEFFRLAQAILAACGLYVIFCRLSVSSPYLDIFIKCLVSLTYFPLLYAMGFFTTDEKEKLKIGVNKAVSCVKDIAGKVF